MNPFACPAARLSEVDRKTMAIFDVVGSGDEQRPERRAQRPPQVRLPADGQGQRRVGRRFIGVCLYKRVACGSES